MIDDEPTEKDYLGRERFVQTVVEAICDTIVQGELAQYVGVYGPWGCGKTSVYLQVRAFCEKRKLPIQFVDFNPWQNNKNGDFGEALCLAMSKVRGVESNITKDFALLGWKIANHGSLSNIAQAFEGNSWWALLKSLFTVADAIKERLNKYLAELTGKSRIVVAIDDIDRLAPEEIVELIRLIKMNGDWKNVTYLLLADRDYMASSIQNCIPNAGFGNAAGLRYIEKIIPIALDVPKPSRQKLSDYAWNEVIKVIDERNLGPQKISTWGFVVKFFDNLRSAKRYINTVRSQLYHFTLDVDGRISVDMSDFLALTAIRLFEPAFYDAIYEYRNLLVVKISEHALKERRTFTKGEVKQFLCPNAEIGRWDDLFNFMLNCLGWGEAKEASGNEIRYTYVLVGDQVLEADAKFKLASPKCIEHYFTGETEEGLLATQWELDNFASCCNSVVKAEQFLVGMHQEIRLTDFLTVLSQRDIPSKQVEIETLLRTIARIADKPIREGGDDCPAVWTGLEESKLHDWAWIVFSQIYAKVSHNLDERANLILRIAKEEAAVYVIAMALLESSIIQSDDIRTELKRVYIDNVLRMIEIEHFWKHPKLVKMYHMFKVSLRGSKDKDRLIQQFNGSIAGDYQHYPNVTFTMASFLTPREDGPESVIPACRVNFNDVDEYLDIDAIKRTLAKVEQRQALPAFWLVILRSLEYWTSCRDKGLDISDEEVLNKVLSGHGNAIMERWRHKELVRGVQFSG